MVPRERIARSMSNVWLQFHSWSLPWTEESRTVPLKYIYFTTRLVAALLRWQAVILKFCHWALGLTPCGKHLKELAQLGSAAALVGGFYITECFALKYFASREDTLEFSEAECGITKIWCFDTLVFLSWHNSLNSTQVFHFNTSEASFVGQF